MARKINGKQLSARVTLADVAAQANVSTTTVSLILSDREEYLRQFLPETIRRVRDTARSLNYGTNLFASGLPTKSSPFFGLIVRDMATETTDNWHHWAFEGDLVSGVMRAAAQAGLYPILAAVAEVPDEAGVRAIERIVDGGVMGTIVRSPHALLETPLRARMQRGHRVVLVFPNQPSKWKNNAISVDNAALAQLAADLLHAQGCKRWGIIRYKNIKPRESHRVRTAVFERAARQVGATVQIIRIPRLVDNVIPPELPELRGTDLDGVFAVDSVLSVSYLLCSLRAGRRPGHDFQMVGVNCSKWRPAHLPRITSIDVSWREAGLAAVKGLAHLSENGGTKCPTVLIRPTVVPGDTCPIQTAAATSTE